MIGRLRRARVVLATTLILVLVAGVLVACVATPPGAIRLGAEIGAGLSAVVGALAMTFGAKALTGTFQQSLAALR